MKRTDFSFELPQQLIAQFPPEERGSSRLMVLDRRTGRVKHQRVADLAALLEPGSLLVFNNTKVRKARIRGNAKASGAPVEFLLLKPLPHQDDRTWLAMAQRSKRRPVGSRYVFEEGREGEITGKEGAYQMLQFDRPVDESWLDRYGHIPLPPYIKRGDMPLDGERYQTVYAKPLGSTAAPTAGLHFTQELLDTLSRQGIGCAFITLHVGLGTFLPVRTEHIEDHPMHKERFSIDAPTAHQITQAKAEGRRIIAVGTTSVRTLESAWKHGGIEPGEGATALFIYPGYTFQVADALFTNFHTPESTLLMLVCAFAGRERILAAYQAAIQAEYRFYSYGDAMLIV
ncbi:MAG: tRNA preQ1(34) S-adenosylmethionine ribosyltransferase-isomerase QueA [Treponema sp.]|jgi:S-adenosylmethionine:tRNA ribosyltransferase-isomerase|nr:tRNA preQ1(34) S-adenosylmethionine ribosyltransferase-isomerase QueA [Treponema sp.]